MTSWVMKKDNANYSYTGVGGASTVIIVFSNLYYNVVLAWAIYFLFMSFTSKLPWSHCDSSWNTPQCLRPDWVYNRTMSGCGINETVTKGLVCVNGTLSNISDFTPAVTEFWE